MSRVKSIVVTGGIASGKSTIIQMLQEFGGKGVVLFDCDAEVAKLLQTEEVVEEIRKAFGDEIMDKDGCIDKTALRGAVFSDSAKRSVLESIIHPKLETICYKRQEKARSSEQVHTFLMDVPLYFESKATFQADRVCLAALTPETQLKRLMERDGTPSESAQAIISTQMPTVKES